MLKLPATPSRPLAPSPTLSLAIPGVVWRAKARDLQRALANAREAPEISNELTAYQAQVSAYARKTDRAFGLAERYRGKRLGDVERGALLWLPGLGLVSKLLGSVLEKPAITGMQRVVLDARGQDNLKKAKEIWSEGNPIPANDHVRVPLLASEQGFAAGNKLIAEINDVLAALFPAEKPNLPLLAGALVLALNCDPDPGDEYGWPNAAAIPGEKGIGLMSYGIIREKEASFFEWPELAQDLTYHEFGHLVEGRVNPMLVYASTDGALQEFFSDLFASYLKQVHVYGNQPMPSVAAKNSPDYLKWALGDSFVKDVAGPASLRHAYGKAREDHPLLGNDPACHDWPLKTLPELGAEYEQICGEDRGGVHLNSSAPTHVAFLQTMTLDGWVINPLRIATLAIALAGLTHGENFVGLIDFAKLEWLAAKILTNKQRVPALAPQVIMDSWKTKGINAQLTDQDLKRNPRFEDLMDRAEKAGLL